MPTGWPVAYSESVGASSVPPTSSAPNSSSAAGLCIANAGSERAAMKPANGFASVTVATRSSSALHDA